MAPVRFSPAAKLGLLVAACLGACTVPNQARSRLKTAAVPSEYRSPDGQYVVRLRGGTPATYQLVRAQDGRVLGRAESAIQERNTSDTPLTAYTVNFVFSPDDLLVCVEEALAYNNDGGRASLTSGRKSSLSTGRRSASTIHAANRRAT